MIEETVIFIEELQGSELFHYVSANGVYLGGWNGQPPECAIIVPPPEWADQFWNFDTSAWSESPSQLIAVENQWREEQMTRVANQLLMIEDEDPKAEPGTTRQWRDYRIALRAWVEGNADFPDQSKRPVAPQ